MANAERIYAAVVRKGLNSLIVNYCDLYLCYLSFYVILQSWFTILLNFLYIPIRKAE